MSLSLAGCASRSNAFAPPLSGPVPPGNPSSEPSNGPPPSDGGGSASSGPALGALYFDIPPGPFKVGDEIHLELNSNGPLVAPAGRTIDAVLVLPNGTRLTHTIDIGPIEAVTYCLPSPGRPCEHDRQVEPFGHTMLYFGVGRTPFEQPGTYTLMLVDPKRELSASPVTIEVAGNQTASGQPMSSAFSSSLGDFTLHSQMAERLSDPVGFHHGAVYHHRTEGSSRPFQVQVFELGDASDVRRTIADMTSRHEKRGLKGAKSIDGLPCFTSSDGTSHFVRWASGTFVVAIYTPKGTRAHMQRFVRSMHATFPAQSKR